jgi:hypothetical protein
MANTAEKTELKEANASISLVIGKEYTLSVTGFTYVRDYALIKGTIGIHKVGVIIGDKQNFGMRDMFALKEATGVSCVYTKDKEVNGVVYQQFRLNEIML